MKVTAVIILLICSFSFLLVASSSINDIESLSNQVVVRCAMKDDLMKRLENLGEGAVDIWDVDEDQKLHFRVSAENWAKLQTTQPGCSLLISNVEKYLADIAVKQIKRSVEKVNLLQGEDDDGHIQAYGFDEYLEYDDIIKFYDEEIVQAYSNLAKIHEMDETTVDGNKMYAVHITANTSPENIGKVYIQCLIHAREWISGPVCMHIAKYLCVEYNKPDTDEHKDTKVTDLLKNLEFVIVLVVNPDGYQYSHGPYRLWRKNRSESTKGPCYGTDINRNFNHHWGKVKPHGKRTCDDEYVGDSAASEKETRSIVAYISKLGNVLGALDFHSYSQLILRPFIYSDTKLTDNSCLKWFSKHMSKEINKVNGYNYKTMRGIKLYKVSGSFTDWIYDDSDIKALNERRIASLAIELRGKKSKKEGGYGFELPADQILSTCQEIMPTVVLFASKVRASPLPTNV